MTATNHALTGAVIALAVKRPELAVPLAFLSHFVTDALPHYNPPNTKARDNERGHIKWAKKLENRSFLFIFGIDMFLLACLLLLIPFVLVTDVSSTTVFFSMLAAISPDFIDGRFLIYRIIGVNVKSGGKRGWFAYWHDWVQWMDRPWGIYVELVWAVAMVWLIWLKIK